MSNPPIDPNDTDLQPLQISAEPLKGKKVLITGIANKDSIAYGAARAFKAFGADIAMTYLNDKTRNFTQQLAEVLAVDPDLYLPHDILNDQQTEALFAAIQQKWGQLDVVLHSMAFAPGAALHGDMLDVTRDDFQTTMTVSAHSLIALAHHAVPLMAEGGSIFTLTFFGGDKVVPNYGIMGPAKSCLEGIVRYLAAELGPKNISVNAVSPGPVMTRAASGVAGFDDLMKKSIEKAPQHVLVTPDEIGISLAMLASASMRKVTGEVIFIDGGFHIMAS